MTEKPIFWVDIPTRECVSGDDDGGWTNLAEFTTKEEAVAFIRERIDPKCDDDGRIRLISEGVQ